uniref:Collagen triple helix repeat protein n=1 Tax=Globodera pallida TaxID=36090 RepID=A0A183BKY6_GLOPA
MTVLTGVARMLAVIMLAGRRGYGAVAGGGYGAGRGSGYAGPPRGNSGGGPGGPYRKSVGYNNKGGRGGRPKRDFVMTEAMKKLYNNFDPLCHRRKVQSVPLVLVETSPSFLFDGITANVAEESKDMNNSTVIVPMDSEYGGGELMTKSDECIVTVEANTPIDVLVPVTTEVETAVLNDTVMNNGTVMESTVPMSNGGISTSNGMTKTGDDIGTAISVAAVGESAETKMMNGAGTVPVSKSDECTVTVEAATPIDVFVPVTTDVETAVLNDTVMNTGTVMEPSVPMSNGGISTCNGMTKTGDDIGTAISDCANCRRFANGTINVEMLASFLANLGHTLINFAAKLEDELKQSN